MKPIKRRKEERWEYPVQTKLTKAQYKLLNDKASRFSMNMAQFLRMIIFESAYLED